MLTTVTLEKEKEERGGGRGCQSGLLVRREEGGGLQGADDEHQGHGELLLPVQAQRP